MSDFTKRKLEGQSLPLYSKKPYHGDVNPGREYVEPKLYQQPNYRYDSLSRKVGPVLGSGIRAASVAQPKACSQAPNAVRSIVTCIPGGAGNRLLDMDRTRDKGGRT